MCFSLLLTYAGRQVALPQEAWRDEEVVGTAKV